MRYPFRTSFLKTWCHIGDIREFCYILFWINPMVFSHWIEMKYLNYISQSFYLQDVRKRNALKSDIAHIMISNIQPLDKNICILHWCQFAFEKKALPEEKYVFRNKHFTSFLSAYCISIVGSSCFSSLLSIWAAYTSFHGWHLKLSQLAKGTLV